MEAKVKEKLDELAKALEQKAPPKNIFDAEGVAELISRFHGALRLNSAGVGLSDAITAAYAAAIFNAIA